MTRAASLPRVLAAISLFFAASSAHAQGTGRSMDIDASVISAAMGGASTAVFWGAEPNLWANPALLGYHQGVRWQWGETQLVPGLASDVRFSVTRLTLGGAGFGFENAGDPMDAGGIELDYGMSEGADINGNPTGMFGAFESVDAMGAGLSVGRLIEALSAMRGEEPPGFVRNFDVAAGWRRKDTVMKLAPAPTVGRAEATSRDFGVLVRAGGSTRGVSLGTGAELSVDFAYGYSVINYDDASFVFLNEDQASPPTRQNRHGVALRIAAEQGGAADDGEGLGAFLYRGLDPWVSMGFAYDRVHATAGGFEPGYHLDLAGFELTLANVLSLRTGRVGDRIGGFHHGSWGVGVNVPIGDVAAFRFDYAGYPQPELEDLRRRSYSVVVDPFAVLRALR